jgi:uncharacterized repeat protein (TIGR03803 family)
MLLAALPFFTSGASAQLTTLHNFTGNPSDGSTPYSGLLIGSGGVLYGTTSSGGTAKHGTVFSLTPPVTQGGAWTEAVLYSFAGGTTDGATPCYGTLAVDSNGVLYGTTEFGGTKNDGTVFSLTPPVTQGGAWTESLIYSFAGGSDGATPLAGLAMEAQGVLYGTTEFGGAGADGTVFSLTPPAKQGGAWTESVLYSFTDLVGDGKNPFSALAIGSGGVLYGTTNYGGTANAGTVFSLTPPVTQGGAWTETLLYDFTGLTDGSLPAAGVIGSNGLLYGTTQAGGASGRGTVFSLTPAAPGDAWTETVLYSFTGASGDGATPFGGVALGSGGVLYGTTLFGGADSYGTVFSLIPPVSQGSPWIEIVLHSFPSSKTDGYAPDAGVVVGSGGLLYGTTSDGGTSNDGILYQFQTANYTISGQVSQSGAGLSGVTVTLSGTESATTTTDSNGNYSFTEPGGGNYTVTPSLTGYVFTPASQTFDNLSANQTADFTGAIAYTISGQVVNTFGAGVSGVTMTVSGTQTGSTVTNSSGNYSFTLGGGGSYTVTPTLTGYVFTPPSQTFNNLSANQTANFTASVSYTISGQVTLTGAGLSGVTMTLSGSQSATTTTSSSGNYSFTVAGGGSYTVTPSLGTDTFTPPSQTFNNVSANQTGNFTVNTFTITGQVTLSGAGLAGVTMTLSGSQIGTAVTTSSGNYIFTVPGGGSYTVTPTLASDTFSPPNQTFNNLSANQTANFAVVTYTISGQVTLATNGLSGVTVTLSGSQTGSTTTSSSGSYTFTVPGGGNYTVTPSLAGYAFTPPSQTFNTLSANQTANFTATASFTISGQVTLAGAGLSGVTMTLSGSQSGSPTTVTNSSGNYSFSVLAGGTYTVTPSLAGYLFTPPSQTFSNVTGNQTANFAVVTYTISGLVSTLSGAGLSGVTITLSGSQSGSSTTSGSGNYSFTVPAGGSYTVTPSLAGDTFTPPSQTFNNLSANQTANFTVNLYAISGQVVTLSGAGLSGVTMTLSGSQTGSTTTNGTGNYSFAVPAGGSYTVTPSLSGYTFTPPSLSFTNLSSGQTANFTANLVIVTYTISGQVTLFGSGLSGVTMTLNGSQSGSPTTTTDANGNYSFAALAGGNYTVTPSLAPYIFNPPSQTFNNLSANQTANFSVTTYTISGQATTFNGAGLSGVAMTLSGSQSGSATTDGNGNYSFAAEGGGSYTVTPSLAAYKFNPASQTFANLSASQTANFQGVVPSDFNGDGHPDVIWEEPKVGWAQVWYLGGSQGVTITGAADLTQANPWNIVGIGDFNGDGTPDVVWQNPVNGAVQVWYLGGPGGVSLIGAADICLSNPWRVASVADFNQDGHPDLLWQDPTSGFAQIWYLNGVTLLGAANLDLTNPWNIVGTGDFNNDGFPDVLWQDPVSGTVQVWYMGGSTAGQQGTQLLNALNLTGPMTTKVVAIADFNLDGHPDVVFQDPVSGAATVYYYTGADGITPDGTAVLSTGNPWYIAGPH